MPNADPDNMRLEDIPTALGYPYMRLVDTREVEISEVIAVIELPTPPPPPVPPPSIYRRVWIVLNTDVWVLWDQVKTWWRTRR